LGSEPHLRYRFPVDPYKQLVRGGGKEQINYRERGQLPYVKKGEVVADVVVTGESEPGISVTGEEIGPESFGTRDIEPGKNVSMIGSKFIAQIDGAPRLNSEGLVEIFPEWVVEGDVEIKTGNIIFPGPVKIKGDIQPGFLVKARSIKARSIENKTQIVAEEAIHIEGGILGGTINCGGDLNCRFIQNATVLCGGNVNAQTSIINSDVGSAGTIKTQTIFGGSITAKSGVDCVKLSSEANRSTVIVGVDPINQENISNIIREKIDIEGQIHYIMEKAGDELKFYERYKQVREEVKPLISERESLNQRLGLLKEDDEASKEFFEGRLGEIAEVLDPLEKEVKTGAKRFEQVRQQYMNELMIVDRLRKRLADLEKQQKAIHVEKTDAEVLIPKLYVRGQALTGTKISSTQARLVLKRDYSRVVFFQRKIHETERKKYGKVEYLITIDRL
jgi:uncharacterized protein (DUF342 family)